MSVADRYRYRRMKNVHMSKKHVPERNEALAWHFERIASGRGIGTLREDMKEAGIDIGTGTLDRLKHGDAGVRMSSLNKLARYARCEPESLLSMPIDRKEQSNVVPGPDIKGTVPLISWVQAGYGMSAVDNLHPGEGEKIETTYKARRHTYALRVRGDSMEPKFPQGCIVIVEPEDDPIHGKFVIVRRNGDEPTLKQYIDEGGTKFLKPVNPRYPIEVMREDDVFCGVVKRLEMDV